MAPWQDDFVEVNGLIIHYYRTGGDKPQVVLDHGEMDDGLCWTEIARELESEYDVIMPDARGHGKSDAGQGEYSSEARANDLIGLIEVLGLMNPVVGGHSMGADTSLHAAILHPDLISGLYIEDPPIALPGQLLFGGEMAAKVENIGKMMVRMMTFFRIAPKFLSRPFARKMMPVSPPDVIDPWINSKKRLSSYFMQLMLEPGSIMAEFSLDLLDKVQSPAMLIHGDRDAGAIVSKEAA